MDQVQKEMAEEEFRKKDDFLTFANSRSKVSHFHSFSFQTDYFFDLQRYPLLEGWSLIPPNELQLVSDCNIRLNNTLPPLIHL